MTKKEDVPLPTLRLSVAGDFLLLFTGYLFFSGGIVHGAYLSTALGAAMIILALMGLINKDYFA